MNRRALLKLLAALPFVGWFTRKAEAGPMLTAIKKKGDLDVDWVRIGYKWHDLRPPLPEAVPGSKYCGLTFHGGRLAGCLTGYFDADFSDCEFECCRFRNICFSRCNFEGAVFHHCEFEDTVIDADCRTKGMRVLHSTLGGETVIVPPFEMGGRFCHNSLWGTGRQTKEPFARGR